MKKRIVASFLLSLIICCISSVICYADDYIYKTTEGTTYYSLYGLVNSIESSLLLKPNKSITTFKVLDKDTDETKGTFSAVKLSSTFFILPTNVANEIVNASGVYKDAYVVTPDGVLHKIDSSGDETVDMTSIYQRKTENMSSALNWFLNTNKANGKMDVSNDLGIASTVNGQATGQQWWGINKEDITADDVLRTVFITTDVPNSVASAENKLNYYILFPPGVLYLNDGTPLVVNEPAIESVKKAIFDAGGYKEAVKKAVIAASMDYCANIMTYGADNLTKVSDLVTEDNGVYKVKTSNMSYALSYVIHPGFGYMDSTPSGDVWFSDEMMTRLTNVSTNGTKIDSSKELGMLTAQNDDGSQGDGLRFVPNALYKEYINGTNTDDKGISKLTTTEALKKAGLQSITGDYSKMVYYGTDYTKAAVPMKLSKDASGNFALSSVDSKYKVFDNVYYNVKTNNLASFNGSKYTDVTVLNNLDVTNDTIYFHKATVNGNTIGVAVFTKLAETIVNPNQSGDASVKLPTGRFLNVDLSKGASLGDTSGTFTSISNWQSKDKKGIALQSFAFSGGFDNPELKASHAAVSTDDANLLYTLVPMTRDSNATNIIDGVKNPYFGVVRNNTFIDDSELNAWVNGGAIKNAPVDFDTLKKLLAGGLNETKEQLTYETWKKMQNIKQKLEDDQRFYWLQYITVPMIIFGVLIMIYGILIPLAYFFDIFNVFSEISLLHLLTFKRVYPVADDEEAKYLQGANKGKYVGKKWVIITFFICEIVGILFANYRAVILFLATIFYWVAGLTGGILK